MIQLSFHGATGTVTGSKYLLTVNDRKVLIDCGMYQGRRELRQRNWQKLPFDPKELDAVIITHGHIDHIGYLPKLVKEGFTGRIYMTPPTIELAKILLRDTAHIQEEDAEYRNRKGLTRHKEALPLYTAEDVKKIYNQFARVNFNEWERLGNDFKFRYHVAGHILGAGSVEIKMDDETDKRSILFSGDVGRYAIPFVNDPEPPPETDYIVCESTYGGEVHPPQDIFFAMAEIIDDIIKRKSVLVIPAFAVGRTQQITYIINALIRQKRIPPIKVHLDSPMAVRVTDIYRRYPTYHQINKDLLRREKNVFYGKSVTLHRKRKSSKKLNRIKGPAIIISASGMLTGGRILHHMINRLPKSETTVLLVGYMAEGTLGRHLLDGDKTIYIHKQPVEVKAKIIKLLGLSAHADSYELLHWLDPVPHKPTKVFITHGEPDRSRALAKQLQESKGWNCYLPQLDETVRL